MVTRRRFFQASGLAGFGLVAGRPVDPATDTWAFRPESTDAAGAWRLFAEYGVRRLRD